MHFYGLSRVICHHHTTTTTRRVAAGGVTVPARLDVVDGALAAGDIRAPQDRFPVSRVFRHLGLTDTTAQGKRPGGGAGGPWVGVDVDHPSADDVGVDIPLNLHWQAQQRGGRRVRSATVFVVSRI